MLDLKSFAERYIPESIDWFQKYGEIQNDEQVSLAVRSPGMYRSDRSKHLLKWLHDYHVLQSFTSETENRITEQVIAFADSRTRINLNQNKELIFEEFKSLELLIQSVVPANKSGKLRNVTSLASKSLWCCYPQDIPIYDNYAEYALQVICRICSIKIISEANGANSKYSRFLEAWFHIYKEIEPIILGSDMKGYPYKIRVLDSLLWYTGQPKFDFIQS